MPDQRISFPTRIYCSVARPTTPSLVPWGPNAEFVLPQRTSEST